MEPNKDAYISNSNLDKLNFSFDNSQGVLLKFNCQTDQFDYISPSIQSMLFTDPDELLREGQGHLLKNLYTDDQPLFNKALERALEIGFSNVDYRFNINNVDYIWISECMIVTQDNSGRLSHIYRYLRDITYLKKVETTLQKSYKQLQAIIDNSANIAYVKDLEGRFILTNRRMEEFNQVNREEFKGKTSYDLYPKDRADWHSGHDKEVINSGKPIIYQAEIDAADGQHHIFLSNKFPLFDMNDKVYAVAGISTDITKLITMEKALEKSEERYRKYFELGLVGMAIESPEGKWIEVNERLCEIMGYTRAELMKKDWRDITHPDDLEKDLGQFRQLQEGTISHYSLDKRYIRKDGEIIFCLLSVGCSKDAKGKISDIYVIVDDITAEKHYEVALIKAKEDLMTAVRVVLSGKQYINQVVSSLNEVNSHHTLLHQHDKLEILTPKQRHILRLVASGNTSEQIASNIFLSKRTVDYHRSCIMKKLGLHTQPELIRYCIEAGISISNE